LKTSLSILFLLAFSFCVKKNVPEDKSLLGLDYYPTKAGKFVVYDVDSIIYTELPKDTVIYKYRIKEKLADTYTDNEGRPAIRLERYIKKYNASKPYDSLPWAMKEVWMVNADDHRVQVVESNVRYTKLVFPIERGATWNGNANNTLGEWNYKIDYIEKEETINGNLLPKVLLVIQKDFRTQISYQRYAEKYAKNVGLVYREMKELLSNTIVPGVPVEDRIESGLIYKQTLVTYGHE
jgi:hypothetical protein